MTSAKIAKLQSLTSDRKNASISFSDDEEPENEDEKSISRDIEYKTGEVGYSKLDQRSHILHRPDTYIGSVDRIKSSGKIWVKGKDRFECKEVYMTEGLLRVFMEIVSNAIDNIWRSKERKIQPKLIEINIDRTNGWISVWNDGVAIPLGKFKNSKTGVVSDTWTPEEIFGELLTGSNYDDEEKRKSSGRNGYGSKSLALGTKLLLWDGTIKTCENIKIGDRLIGDDGKPRSVTDVFTGKNKLWEIHQAYGQTYTVSAGHILTLHMPDYGTIFWNKSRGGWHVLWWDFKSKSIKSKYFFCHNKPKWMCPICNKEFTSSRHRHYRRVHEGAEIPEMKRNSPTVIAPDTQEVREARINAEKFVSSLPPNNIIDITVEDFLSLNKTTQRRLAGLRGKCIDWPSQLVDLDPYILGMWLGDGLSSGEGFASEDTELINEWVEWTRKNESEILHVRRDNWRIRRKRFGGAIDRCPVGDIYTSNAECRGCKQKLCSACSNDQELEALGLKRIISLQPSEYSLGSVPRESPFKQLLRKYRLINNKRIPSEYLLNDRNTRLALLAGLIDTDGTVSREGTRISIVQGMNHSALADDILLLVRSLGFACSMITCKTQWKYKGELRRGLAKHIEISGEGVQDIPTRLPRKKCMPPKDRDTARTMGYIKISKKPEGEWVGITVDGNHRFCLDDMTVIHNCTNVLSKVFEIELFNPEYKAIYRQRWTENMSQKEPAVWDKVKSHFPTGKGKGGYTLVRFNPDYARFGYSNGIDDDMMSVLEKSIYDYAMIAALNDVSTIYNGTVVPISGLKDYVALYYDKLPEELLQLTSEDCSVIVAPKADTLFKGDLMHVAFINGIITAKGGVHVDAWDEAIFRPIVQKLNGESKKKKDDGKKKVAKKKKSEEKKRPTIDISHVRKYFSLFIVAEANNPRFTGQNKEVFNSPPIHTKVKKSDISKLMQWSFVDRIEESIKLKEFASLKDAGKKKRNYLNIPNLDDANNAGHPKLGKQCIIMITEGDSAASYVAVGMQFGIEGKIGQDWVGLYPLKGKLLNCRKAPIAKILKNKEIMGVIRALGLEYGIDYLDETNRNKLRYGKLYVVADGDSDGCWSGDTPINLPSGLSVQIGQMDHVPQCVSWYEKCDGLMPANVTKFMDKGVKDVVEITFEDGRTAILTPDHKLCSIEGKWIEAKDAQGLKFKADGIFPILNYDEAKSDWTLQAGTMKFSMDTKSNIDRTLAFARILGMFLSDGHFDSTYCEIYVGNMADCKSVIEDAKLFVNESHIKLYNRIDSGGIVAIRFRTCLSKNCTSLEGVLRGGRTSQVAALPAFILDSKCPLIVVREFLGGLFGGDGVAPCLTKYKTRCSRQRRYHFDGLGFVQSKQPEHVESLMDMMKQVGSLLRLFDIESLVRKQPRRGGKGTSELVKIFVARDDYLKFADRIGFRHCIHKSRRLSCVQSYFRLYELVREQRKMMQKRGLELRAEGKNVTQAHKLSVEEFKSKNLVLHPASLIIPGNLKYTAKNNKYLNNLCRSGFDDPLTFLRKIDGLKYFITEDDIKADTNRQGTAQYGNTKEDLFISPLKLTAIQVKHLQEQKHVYDLSIEDPTHCFLAGGIVAHNCHITGLVANFFGTLFPSLLKANFLHFLRIPIVKINMKQETLTFLFYYSSQQYISTHQIPNSKKAIKYFKGLGTFKPKEIGDDFGKYPVALIFDEKSEELLSKVFGKDDTEFRKQWLLEHQDKILERKTPDFEIEQLPINSFLENEMRLYSIDSCIRAIPCILDGFKESTRKIICSAFTRPLNHNGDELKVVQLAGYVAEKMGYHHGEQNIPDTIIGLAQSFPGSNNIPLLVAAGNFGSRQGGGPNLTVGNDSAAPRYIFTKLEMLTRYIFREEDEIFLPDRIQDGEVVEKQYYMPIIPMLLVNGTSGIGTAHSTNVPQYNPLDLMKWIEVWLDNKGKIKTEAKGLTFYETPTLCPYYRGFTGKIEVDGAHIKTYGIMEQTSKHTWTITELPLGRLNVSIKNYCEKLKKMREEQKIKSFTSQKPTLNKPYFTVTADEDGIIPNLQNMKLVDSLTTTNMVLFDEKGKLMKFSSIEEIMEYYCSRRYAFYTIRIEGMLANLRVDLKWIVNKLRFIQLVHNKKLSISNREESELEDELDSLKFDRKTDSRKSKSKKEEKSEEKKEEEPSGTFDYLLSMQIKCLNIASVAYKKLEKEKAQFEEQIRELENTTVEKLWKSEMEELKTAHAKWEKKMENESKAPVRNKNKKDKG
jgi:DNA gyrase/topoisomerase IV subunit B